INIKIPKAEVSDLALEPLKRGGLVAKTATAEPDRHRAIGRWRNGCNLSFNQLAIKVEQQFRGRIKVGKTDSYPLLNRNPLQTCHDQVSRIVMAVLNCRKQHRTLLTNEDGVSTGPLIPPDEGQARFRPMIGDEQFQRKGPTPGDIKLRPDL